MQGSFSLHYVDEGNAEKLSYYLVRYLAALCKCHFGTEEPEDGGKEFRTVSVHPLINTISDNFRLNMYVSKLDQTQSGHQQSRRPLINIYFSGPLYRKKFFHILMLVYLKLLLQGVQLLSYLYKEALDSASSPNYPMVLSMLHAACGPYLMWVY